VLVTCPCPAAPQHAACPWVAVRTVPSYAYPVVSLSCPVAPAHTAPPARLSLALCLCLQRSLRRRYSTVGPSRTIDHTGLPIQSHPTHNLGQFDRHCSCRHHRCHTHPPRTALHYLHYTTLYCTQVVSFLFILFHFLFCFHLSSLSSSLLFTSFDTSPRPRILAFVLPKPDHC